MRIGETIDNKISILIVGSNLRNLELLADFLCKLGYKSITAQNKAQIVAALENTDDIALALIDITGFSSAIWEECQEIHQRNIQILVFSPKQSAAVQKDSIASGARGVLVKPLVMQELAELINKLVKA